MSKKMTNVSKNVNLSVTRLQKTPCLYERGGYNPRSRKGYVIVICDKDGKRKQAISIREEENNRHALIPVNETDICIEAIKDDRNEALKGYVCINLWQINKIKIFEQDSNVLGDAEMILLNNYSFDVWNVENDELVAMLSEAIEAAKVKCQEENCKRPVFIQERKQYFKKK